MSRWSHFAAAAVFGLLAVGQAAADVVHLKTGGKVEGSIVSRTQTTLVVQTAAGKVTLKAADVDRIEAKASPLDVYREMAAKLKGDDADGRFALGLWCQENGLFRQAREEFEKAVALDPNHKRARAKLGYVLREGRWLTEADAKKADGLVKVGSKWVTEEERNQADQRKAVAEWAKQIRLLLAKRPVSEEAMDARIRDAMGDRPRDAADVALRVVLEDLIKESIEERRDRTFEARVVLVNLIATQKAPEAAELLRKAAVRDIDGRVRSAAIKALAAQKDVENVAYFVALLRRFTSPKVRLEGNKQTRTTARRVLRRASEALAGMGDPRAIPALAETMVVLFYIKENTDELPPMSIGFSKTAVVDAVTATDPLGNQLLLPVTESSNWGLDPNQDRDTEDPLFFNDAAYNALRNLTSQDFSHDKRAWLAWWYRNRHNLED